MWLRVDDHEKSSPCLAQLVRRWIGESDRLIAAGKDLLWALRRARGD